MLVSETKANPKKLRARGFAGTASHPCLSGPGAAISYGIGSSRREWRSMRSFTFRSSLSLDPVTISGGRVCIVALPGSARAGAERRGRLASCPAFRRHPTYLRLPASCTSTHGFGHVIGNAPHPARLRPTTPRPTPGRRDRARPRDIAAPAAGSPAHAPGF